MNSKKEAVTTGLFSSFVFFTIVMFINFSLLGNISALAGKEMPAVFIADLLFPHIGGICYSVILYSSIYTTAVPMLWTACNRIAADDKSLKFKLCAAALAITAYFIGGFPFSVLINFIYPYIGYAGIFVFMIIRFGNCPKLLLLYCFLYSIYFFILLVKTFL